MIAVSAFDGSPPARNENPPAAASSPIRARRHDECLVATAPGCLKEGNERVEVAGAAKRASTEDAHGARGYPSKLNGVVSGGPLRRRG